MPIRIVQVDAFTNVPFAGNPAAVCVLQAPPDDEWMRDVARRNEPLGDRLPAPRDAASTFAGSPPRWRSIFAAMPPWPARTCCGKTAIFPPAVRHVSTPAAAVAGRRRGEWIELDFPAKVAAAAEPPPELLPGLGVRAVFVAATNSIIWWKWIRRDAAGAHAGFHGVAPDSGARRDRDGAIHRRFDFVSRFFAPGSGIDEDPVTGSAHCALGPYWAERLGKSEFTAFQASARGGVVRVRLKATA